VNKQLTEGVKKMNLLFKNKTVIAIAVAIIILVMLRTFSSHFKNDAKKLAQPSFGHLAIITEEQISTLAGNILFISLDKDEKLIKKVPGEAVNIPADSVLNKKYRKVIFKHAGPVLLFAADPSVSARIWMILSQMGRYDIFILAGKPDYEIFKYKFRSDTLIRPEL
jgi:hypothetical protein